MGKYSKIIATLQKLTGEEPEFQAKVNAVKSVILEETPRHASAFAELYAKTRTGDPHALPLSNDERDDLITRLGKEGIEDLLSSCNVRLCAVEQLLSDQYEVEGVTSLKLDNIGSVGVQLEPYAQVQDKIAYQEWCLKEGLLPLMTVPWATTNSMTKDRLLAGENPPPGVGAFVKTKFVLRKS